MLAVRQVDGADVRQVGRRQQQAVRLAVAILLCQV